MNREVKEIKEAYCYEHEHYCDEVFLKNKYKKKLEKIEKLAEEAPMCDSEFSQRILEVIHE